MKNLRKWLPALWVTLGAFQIILAIVTGKNLALGISLGALMLIIGIATYASQKKSNG